MRGETNSVSKRSDIRYHDNLSLISYQFQASFALRVLLEWPNSSKSKQTGNSWPHGWSSGILSKEVATGHTTTTDKAVRFAGLAVRACQLLQPHESHPYQCVKTISIMLSFYFLTVAVSEAALKVEHAHVITANIRLFSANIAYFVWRTYKT